MAATGMPQREKVLFVPNVQQQIALKWPDGKIVSGVYGEQMMYSLSDGRVCFLDMDVAAKINMLEVRPNEPFCICKRWNGQKGQPVRWDVWKTGERYVDDDAPEPEPPSEMVRQLDESIRQVQARQGISSVPRASGPPPAPVATPNTITSPAPRSHVTVTDGRPKTKLEDALKTVVSALHATNEYSKSIGYAMPQFGADEICRMVNTLLIEGRK